MLFVRAVIGMALGFAYFVVDNAALAMGNFGGYPPLVAAWSPFLLFALIGETVRDFEATHHNIETCFNRISARYIKAFDEIDDEYLRERASDIRDVAQRMLRNLLGQAARCIAGAIEGHDLVVAAVGQQLEAPCRHGGCGSEGLNRRKPGLHQQRQFDVQL